MVWVLFLCRDSILHQTPFSNTQGKRVVLFLLGLGFIEGKLWRENTSFKNMQTDLWYEAFPSLLTNVAVHKASVWLNYMLWQWDGKGICRLDGRKVKSVRVVKAHLKTSAPILHSVSLHPSKSSWALVLQCCTLFSMFTENKESRRSRKL